MARVFYAYTLKSVKDGKYYHGHCGDLEKRLNDHNKGRTRSRKSRKPFTIHYYEVFETKSASAKREVFFKSIDGYNYLKEKGII